MKPMKFRVINVNHSKHIQEVLIDAGCFWPGDVQKPFHLESQYIYVDEDGCISHGNDVSYYEQHQGEESWII